MIFATTFTITMLVFALFTTALCFLGAYLLTRKRRTKNLSPPPLYPGAWPLIGHIPMALKATQGNISMKVTEIVNNRP